MPSPVACKSCGTVNPEDAFFCTHCGTQLGPVRNCPRCDSALASGAKFCHRCGFQLGVPRSERKTLIMREPTTRPEATLDDLLVTCTVMQIGLIVEHASNGGADAAAVTQEAAAWVESRLTRTGAIVARTGPNLLLAVYRSAATDKDVPMYSVRTALALQNDAEIHNDQQQERLGARFSLKLGLNTGALPVPPDRQLDHEVIRLAGRAQASCTPGAVFIPYPTFDRVPGLFWYRNAEPIAMEGQLAPIPIYEILGERESVTHVDSMGIEGVDTPMVGRQAELQTLREAYQRVARERRPEIVSVIGDTGIGKSRLNFEFLKYLESLTEIISYDFGGCPPDTPAAPYRVWRELLTRRARIFLNDSAGVAREKLIEMVASEYRDDVPPLLEASRDMYSPLRSPSDDEIERIAAGAGHLLELRFKQGAPEGTPPELEIRETYHAIQTYFELKAERRPAVIVLEDMQWADPASIDLLQTLFGNLPDLPILVVTLMSGEFLEAYPEWGD
ncbi:MAG: AAA family ATPase, partial [Myxococcales bacterium]|nr:AAA family ATPase [Myxococcales bacterium]